MDANAIQIAVRPRPFHPEKEVPFLIRQNDQPFFLGDGNFANSPRKVISAGSIRQVIDVVDSRMLNFDTPERGAAAKRGQPGAKRYKDRRYIFDHVLPMDATQEDVFEKTALPLLEGVLTGFNATVFAYGATGCGKTHTISGSPTDAGVIIRTMAELFRRIEESQDEYETFIELSMVEIYNETIRDLLSDDYPNSPHGGLKLLENDKERVTIEKVTLKRPGTVDEVMELVQLGNERRSTSSTAMNAVSSRSHAVLQINVGRNSKGHEINMAESVVRQCMTSATLSIIDLAGSERAAATQNLGERMKEGANINKSLLALSSCITALCQRPIRGQKVHVPYRNSKLTRMLKFSLGGNCRTVMIVCISPSSKDLEDTHNTLVWADRAKSVSTKISRNTSGVDLRSQHYIETIGKLNTEIDNLRAKIATLAANERQYADNKRKLGQEDIHRAVDTMGGMVNAAIGTITFGAEKRARWDATEMAVKALKVSVAAAEAQDDGNQVQFLQSLIRDQDAKYKNDATTCNAIQKEEAERAHIDTILRNTEQRKFGDGADPADLEVVRLKVELKRMEIEKRIAETREKVYRETIQAHATAFATVVAALHKVSAGLEDFDLSSPDGRTAIALLAGMSKSALSSLFKEVSGTVPSMPNISDLGARAGGLSPFASTGAKRRMSIPRPTRNRMSLQPSATVQASPAGKRLLRGLRSPGSPMRPLKHIASPAKRTLRSALSTGGSKLPSAPKTARWKDQAGEGDLEHHKIMTSDSSSGTIAISGEDADESGEWEDAVPDIPVIPAIKPRLMPRSSLARGPRDSLAIRPMTRSLPGPSTSSSIPTSTSPKLPSSIPVVSPPSNSSSSSNNTDKPLPAWKQNRMQRKAVNILGPLRTLDEEGSSASSPESGPSGRTMRGLGLGAPSRPPLGDRKEVPGANTSVSFPASLSASSLFKPTAASLGRQSGRANSPPAPPAPAVSNTTGPRPSAATTGRRVSAVGPVRHERTKTRQSFAPGMNSGSQGHDVPMSAAHLPNAPFGGMPPPVVPSTNALGGGAKRGVFAETASTLNRRASTLNLNAAAGGIGFGGSISTATAGTTLGSVAAGGSFRGPRASVSMAQLPKIRPGIPAFGAPPGSMAVGDTSIRAPWR